MAVVLAVLLGSTSPSIAQGVDEVSLTVEPCLEDIEQDIASLTALEIAPALRLAPAGTQARVNVEVGCRGDRLLSLRIVDRRQQGPGTSAPERLVDLRPSEVEVRARVIALAVAELLADRPRSAAVVEPPSSQPARSAEPRSAPARMLVAPTQVPAFAERWRLSASALGAASAHVGGAVLAGGGVLVDMTRGPASLALDVQLVMGRHAARLGTVELTSVDSSIAAGLRAVLGGHARAGTSVGVRGGVARVEGHPESGAAGARLTGPWGGPLLRAWIGARIGPVGVRLSAEAGLALARVLGSIDQGEQVGFGGAWVRGALVVGGLP